MHDGLSERPRLLRLMNDHAEGKAPQAEVDYYRKKLSAGGQEGRCARLKDKFGVSWQIVPTALIELMQDKDAAKSASVMRAMFQMTKVDIAGLRRAYEGEVQ